MKKKRSIPIVGQRIVVTLAENIFAEQFTVGKVYEAIAGSTMGEEVGLVGDTGNVYGVGIFAYIYWDPYEPVADRKKFVMNAMGFKAEEELLAFLNGEAAE